MLMKRITESRTVYSFPAIAEVENRWLKEVQKRLAAIEDILGGCYDLDRLKELVEADRDGRCVVLPCKIGDTVYDIQMEKITEKTIL